MTEKTLSEATPLNTIECTQTKPRLAAKPIHFNCRPQRLQGRAYIRTYCRAVRTSRVKLMVISSRHGWIVPSCVTSHCVHSKTYSSLRSTQARGARRLRPWVGAKCWSSDMASTGTGCCCTGCNLFAFNITGSTGTARHGVIH